MSVKVPLQWKGNRLIPVFDTDLADFPGEIWKPMPDFDDYELSSHGRVKSLARNVQTASGALLPVREKIVRLAVLKEKDWISITAAMTREGRRYGLRVPRLVYQVFKGELEYDNLSLVVKRSDGDILNVHFSNLVIEDRGKELRVPVHCYDQHGLYLQTYASMHEAAAILGIKLSTIKESIREKSLQGKKYYWLTGEAVPGIPVPDELAIKESRIRAKYRPVQQLTLNGEPMREFESLKAAALHVNGRDTTIILACRNSRLTAYGYKWRYLDVPPQSSDFSGRYNKPVYQYDLNGELVHRYRSASVAAKALGVNSGTITVAINKGNAIAKGHYWRYWDGMDSVPVYIDVSAFARQRQNYLDAQSRPVQQLSRTGKVLAEYPSLTTASNSVGGKTEALHRACKTNGTSRGYRWRYLDGKSER